MSGLLDSIVRRRRASASSRLGPPGRPDLLPLPVESRINGHAPDGADTAGRVNGFVRPEPEPPPEPGPVTRPAELDEQPTEVFAAVVEPVEAPPVLEPDVAPVLEPDVETQAAPDAESQPSPAELKATLRARGAMRRRARYLRSLREVQLRDIGGFMLELHRFGQSRPELVQSKVQSAALADAELRALEQALGTEHLPGELRQPGIGGACADCGAVHGSSDRFCGTCGEPLRGREHLEDPLPAANAPAAGGTAVTGGTAPPGGTAAAQA